MIHRFRELGMSVREVAEVIATTDPDERSALIAGHLGRLESQLGDLPYALAMDDVADDVPHAPPGPRQVARLVLPAFAVSGLVVVIGVIVVAAHHRTLGTVIIVIGAVGGFAVRARIMIRSQSGPGPRP